MGRDRSRLPKARPAATVAGPIRASAERVTAARATDWTKRAIATGGESWQRLAWDFYRSVSEFRFGCDWIGNMLSKATLYATEMTTEDGRVRRNTGPAADVVKELLGRDDDDTAEMLREIGVHLSVAGECFVVATDKRSTSGVEWTEWQIVSVTALKIQHLGQDSIQFLRNNEVIGTDADTIAIRVWRPDPEDTRLATSPARALLPVLGEIRKITQHVSAQLDSRLAGAGLLFVPSEMSFSRAPTTTDADPATNDEATTQQASTAGELMSTLEDAMGRALRDREDPSALVPIVVAVPGETIGQIQHLTFWTPLDENSAKMRDDAIGRLALGMDIPPEVLKGVADSNHWSAWQADESSIKVHAEPLLKVITTSLAQDYLRPNLADTNLDPAVWGIGADTSEMRLRPNRSQEALELYDRGELNGAALRRETGFEETEDAQDDEQRKEWFLRKVASGSATPEQMWRALQALGVVSEPDPSDPSEPERQARPAPSMEDHPVREIPKRPDALYAASFEVINRALERAGNRMRNRGGRIEGIPAGEHYMAIKTSPNDIDFYLGDAWGENLDSIARRYEVGADLLRKRVDQYTRMLLLSGSEHDYDTFTRYMDRVWKVRS